MEKSKVFDGLLLEKLGYTFIIWIVSSICAISPLALNWISEKKKIRGMGLAAAFSGGVFLAGGIVHLMRDDEGQFDSFTTGTRFDGFPFAQLMTVCGIMMVFFVEKVAFVSCVKSHVENHQRKMAAQAEASPPTDMGDIEMEAAGSSDSQVETPKQPQSPEDPMIDSEDSSSSIGVVIRESPELFAEIEIKHCHKIGEESAAPSHHHHVHQHNKGEADFHSHDVVNPYSVMGFFLLIALSIHSFVAGLALGVQPTLQETTPVFVAIITHKWVEAFALGASLVKTGISSIKVIVIAIAYSTVTPLAIIVGAISETFLSGIYGLVFTAIITGLSSGTFIYIALVDILVDEFTATSRDLFPKYILCVFGFVLTSAMVIAFDVD